MTPTIISLMALLATACGSSTPENPEPGPNPEYKQPVALADPFIMWRGDKYYAYGTSSADGILYYTSDDLYTWEAGGLALNKKDVYADRWFWAPEVYYIDSKGKFHMYYSADEHICVATADVPTGPFTQDVQAPIRQEKSIDNSLFIDEDGTPYLYFVRFNDGNNIWVAKLEDDLKTVRESTLKHCLSVTEPWESILGRVVEGPFVVKHNGTYYLTYSANDYQSPDYAIGYATSSSPMGPWVKYTGNPIFKRPEGLVGVGHHAFFKDKEDGLRIVFHSHNSESAIHPRIMNIGSVGFTGNPSGPDIMKIGEYFTPSIKQEVTHTPDNIISYHNPVGTRSLPDPTLISADDGWFYLYATEDTRNLPIMRSQTLTNWEFVDTAFSDDTRPTFVKGGGIWAPDINFIDGQYVLYYSMSTWGGEWACGIGVATAGKPTGPFTDHGKMFISSEIGVQNSIDPFYIEDNGHKYLFWGSFHGIYAIELSEDGLSIKEGAEKVQVAGTAYEGTYIHKKGGYYYLFASTGSCCEGVNSTYKTVVGRSDNLLGPYSDKSGKPMIDNHHEVIIHGNDRFAGTGHNSEIVTDSAGADWILYHAYDRTDPAGRKLLLDRVRWTDGWPWIAGDSPSIEADSPIF